MLGASLLEAEFLRSPSTVNYLYVGLIEEAVKLAALWLLARGGVLFAAAARRGRLRVTGSLFGFYLLVAGLHAVWDAAQPIAVWLMLLLTASPMQWQLLRVGQLPSVTQGQVHLYTALYWAVLALTAAVGLLVLRGRWRRATAREQLTTYAS